MLVANEHSFRWLDSTVLTRWKKNALLLLLQKRLRGDKIYNECGSYVHMRFECNGEWQTCHLKQNYRKTNGKLLNSWFLLSPQNFSYYFTKPSQDEDASTQALLAGVDCPMQIGLVKNYTAENGHRSVFGMPSGPDSSHVLQDSKQILNTLSGFEANHGRKHRIQQCDNVTGGERQCDQRLNRADRTRV